MATQTIGDEAKSDGIMLMVLGGALCIWLASGQHWLVATETATLIVAGLLLHRHKIAGIYLTLGMVLAMSVYNLSVLLRKGLGIKTAIGLLLFVGLWQCWRKYGRILRNQATWDDPLVPHETLPPDSEESDDTPMISIVLLRRHALPLDEDTLSAAVRRAWSHPQKAGDDEELFAVGEGFLFIVRNGMGLWTVHNRAHPYFDDVEPVIASIPEMRLQKAVRDHGAWLSIDLTAPFDKSLPAESFYPHIFRLLRELADGDTLAIFRPETGQINVWDDEVAAKLCGPEPLQDFTQRSQPPVIHVEDDDPLMVAAVTEARASFPDFRKRWLERDNGERFLVKGPVRSGNRQEYIWFSVTDLSEETAYGTLENEPVDLNGLKLGDPVALDLADLNDWAFLPADGTKPLGFHTVKAVDAVGKRTLEAADGS
ncbi:DUF2314 domain-containing protein [Luteolibacter ambystomatis]|uniref:DUF2314 domain-containing protein n=1 Tax=Luteolibacter ambystomatis TaxID=2824561 RepID=A0A975G6U3_9BACT|nr:DUF2314 domain-containing protein [Luteolibacter ambystomatis]QUE50404.1 DUF2314 domain-containing protein [Luteolibacter ambystomatis]